MKKILLVIAVATTALASCQTPTSSLNTMAAAPVFLSDVVARIEKDGTVVDITAIALRQRPVRDMDTRWLNQFFPRVPSFPYLRTLTAMQNLGAGIIISSDGFIVTNAHVVADATEVSVRLADREQPYSADVIGIDRLKDVALLKINARNLPIASVGRSAQLQGGEWVAAVGSLKDRPNTVSAGVVLARGHGHAQPFIPFVRTDLVINPPTSSGPLINAKGEVVGLSSGIVGHGSKTSDTALAVPIEMALDVARNLRVHGEARRGHPGNRANESRTGIVRKDRFFLRHRSEGDT